MFFHRMRQRRAVRRHRERGQSMAELAISFAVLLIIVSGLLDLGRLYYIFVALEDGAGEAALYLSINPSCWSASDGSHCANPNNALYRARNAGGGVVDWSGATITLNHVDADSDGQRDVGELITVSITYSFPLLTPVMPQIAGVNPISLTASATQMIVSR